ncbi:MAG TPA: helix-turn-helix transcriptional regulator [Synergistaceae bacterium]|nr:helix-turn-helix transcriptional regulator [Synergistaceae bacterium]HQA55347.1 helix-turn-helix transcriptional regulator [Synergistaceae bacterium]
MKILIPVVRGLAKILGKDYEVNLHDVSMPEHSLVMCENGHVTGRAPGAPMTDFGLYMLQSEDYRHKEGIYNYLARNNRGELIKCSAIFIRDENEKIIGFMCINYDISKAAAAQELIESLLHLDMDDVEQYPESGADNSPKPDKFPVPIRERYAKELEEVVTDSLTQVKNRIGTPLSYLSKAEKKEVIKELHDRGFFLLKGSVDRVANEMGNTKYTIYSYIRDVQKQEKLHRNTKDHTKKPVE